MISRFEFNYIVHVHAVIFNIIWNTGRRSQYAVFLITSKDGTVRLKHIPLKDTATCFNIK
jgi:hypothetical protein